MKKRKSALIIALAMVAVTVAGIGVVVTELSSTVAELDEQIASNKADAILASSHVDNNTMVTVPVVYYDQVMDECENVYDLSSRVAVEERQFEWRSCGYYNLNIETGLVDNVLDENYLPVALGGDLLPNRGMNKNGFERWFNVVEGKSKNYAATFSLNYDASDASFTYEDNEFYPLDEISVPSETVNSDGSNHLFTMNLGVPFKLLSNGEERFTITADDDTWVFVGNQLVLDMGGIHEAMTGAFEINEQGEIYSALGDEDLAYSGVKLNSDDSSIVRIFHADRNSGESVFKLKFENMVLNITNASLAKGEAGVEVAYDPENPSYVAPLGESLVIAPDRKNSLTTAIMVQSVVICAIAIVLMTTISVAWRCWRRDHSRVE